MKIIKWIDDHALTIIVFGGLGSFVVAIIALIVITAQRSPA